MEIDFPRTTKTPTETYWFYNDFFKIFPDSGLLQYNDDKDAKARSNLVAQPLPTLTLEQSIILALYLPSLVISFLLAFPVLVYLGVVTLLDNKTTHHDSLTMVEHAKVILIKAMIFLQQRLVDSKHNIEANSIMGMSDPLPFLVRNHVQVVVRLLASLRTGIEWKKLDFAIGKVVEVGGD